MSSVNTSSNDPFYVYMFMHGEIPADLVTQQRNQYGFATNLGPFLYGRTERDWTWPTRKGDVQAIELAEKLAKIFEIAVVYSSPAKRCVEAAREVQEFQKECAVCELKELAAIQLGSYEGYEISKIKRLLQSALEENLQENPKLAENPFYKWDYSFEDIETISNVWQRYYNCLKDLANEAIQEGGKAIFVSATALPIISLITFSEYKFGGKYQYALPMLTDSTVQKVDHCDVVQFLYNPNYKQESGTGTAFRFIKKVSAKDLGTNSFQVPETKEPIKPENIDNSKKVTFAETPL